MAIPVIDFSKLDGGERAETLAQIANGCEEWGFFQVFHSYATEMLGEQETNDENGWVQKPILGLSY